MFAREATIRPVADDPLDPEDARIEELLARVARHEATDAEREELAMYEAERPDLPARIQERARARELGGEWMARIEGDHRVQRHEQARTTRVERTAGLAMILGGMALGFLAPTAGTVGIVGGFAVLMYSFVRVRLRTHRDDPYKDVNR